MARLDAVSFGTQFIAAAPPEWKRTAQRTGVADRTIQGLFRTEQQTSNVIYGNRPPDLLPRFEVTAEDAQAFGLAVKDRLLIDGQQFHVVELIPNDCGTVSATLRRYG